MMIVPEEHGNEMSAWMKQMMENATEALKRFGKKTYPDCFEELKIKYRPLMIWIEQYINEHGESAEHELAEKLVLLSKEMVDARKWKFRREQMQADLNIYMIVYVIPMFRDYGGIAAERFADVLLEQWNERFGTQLLAGTYEQILGGFSNRIFGISLGGGK